MKNGDDKLTATKASRSFFSYILFQILFQM